MLTTQKGPFNQSLSGSVQSPERKDSIRALAADIASRLPPNQVLACAPICLSRSGAELVDLRVGGPKPAEFVRFTMLTLELFRTISADSFEALRHHFVSGAPSSDWHALNAETFGLGQTRDSVEFAVSRAAILREAFWRGFRSVFNPMPTAVGQQLKLQSGRLEFVPDPEIRDIFLSALTPEGNFRCPELTQSN
ncbi:MAG: hypothetical protein DCC75_00240 [Proteobacteria bacterium]|nr:MAG: hypothetical protein DCC75_00240 [Pseudomonadota bacterium]